MYIYEKFFTVTKVHGYKIISIQRLASSLTPTLPDPPTPRHQHSMEQCLEKRRAWVARTLDLGISNMVVMEKDPSLSFTSLPSLCISLECGEKTSSSSFGEMF